MRVIPFITPPAQHYDLEPVYRQLRQLPIGGRDEVYAEGGVLVSDNALRLNVRLCDQRDDGVFASVCREYDQRAMTWGEIVADFNREIFALGVMPR
jgi:hypothetical protein